MKRFWLVTALALLADAASKWLAYSLLGAGRVSLGWLMELSLTRNTGMALGIFAGHAWAGMVLPVLAIGAGALLMRRYVLTAFTAVCCGLVAGGFIGNYVQRLSVGYVLDMIYFPWMPWFVCNVADICICFGVAGLALSLLARPQDWQERSAKDA